jgi:hydrogenase maturation protein HypF
MPFERPDTAMDRFPLCDTCQKEYDGAGDRRFHAQTTACPACGPKLAFHSEANPDQIIGSDALKPAVEVLRAGQILAIKGLGGYQLLVDATNQAAVERLRKRKNRRAKPLAVMARTEALAQQLAHLDVNELAAYRDPAAPIVLARLRSEAKVAPAVSFGLNTIGIMRPTTPLHALLAEAFSRPIVCTSANGEGEPLEYICAHAEKHLNGVADGWLNHDREIVRPLDDSVVRIIAGQRSVVRLARGLAPLPLDLPTMQPVLALGGHMKASIAWSNGAQSCLGPHLGDQETLAARERYLAHLKDMLRLYQFRPKLLVHDLHPNYFTTEWAARQKVPRLGVQHHHAHVAAGMLQHGWLDRKVLGVSWDGTGYGTDGTIWGGEFLVCLGAEFERVGRLRPFALPGGDVAAREPWRSAISVCSQLEGHGSAAGHANWQIESRFKTQVLRLIKRPNLSAVTSSAGRLIDAAAALILGIDRVDYEGEAAMRLEAAADRDARGWYHFPIEGYDLQELDWRPLFAGLIEDINRGADVGTMAMKFHRSLAHGIVGLCRRWRELPVVLTGGVFQNKLLVELILEMQQGYTQLIGLPGIVPVNDGGLAAGQLAIAAATRKA